jgi:CO/xanthine dehydrogenase Mo-binding subunit
MKRAAQQEIRAAVGVWIKDQPITPEEILEAIRESGRSA